MSSNSKQRPWTGFLAGAIGGLAGSFVMSQLHYLLKPVESPAKQDGEDSTVKAASAVSQRVFHHHLTAREKKLAGPAVHYAFGCLVGAAYGVAAELDPRSRFACGMPFGAAVWLGAHAIGVPAAGLSKPITKSSPRQEAIEFAAHLVYGAAVEGIRRLIRR